MRYRGLKCDAPADVVEATTAAVRAARESGIDDLLQCADLFDGILRGTRSAAMAAIAVMGLAARLPMDPAYAAIHALADTWFDLAANCADAEARRERCMMVVRSWLDTAKGCTVPLAGLAEKIA